MSTFFNGHLEHLPPSEVFSSLVDSADAVGADGLLHRIEDMCPGCRSNALMHAVFLAYCYGKGYCVCDIRRHDGPPCQLHNRHDNCCHH